MTQRVLEILTKAAHWGCRGVSQAMESSECMGAEDIDTASVVNSFKKFGLKRSREMSSN